MMSLKVNIITAKPSRKNTFLDTDSQATVWFILRITLSEDPNGSINLAMYCTLNIVIQILMLMVVGCNIYYKEWWSCVSTNYEQKFIEMIYFVYKTLQLQILHYLPLAQQPANGATGVASANHFRHLAKQWIHLLKCHHVYAERWSNRFGEL